MRNLKDMNGFFFFFLACVQPLLLLDPACGEHPGGDEEGGEEEGGDEEERLYTGLLYKNIQTRSKSQYQ